MVIIMLKVNYKILPKSKNYISNKNKLKHNSFYVYSSNDNKTFKNFNKISCIKCPNNPDNGGTGICCCTLGQMSIT